MKVVYIAGPYRGDNAWHVEKNIQAAEELAFEVTDIGAMPLCPHSMCRYWNGTRTDKFWLDGTLELMRRCDAVLLLRGWSSSAGSRAEKDEAERLGMPVFFYLSDLKDWHQSEEVPNGKTWTCGHRQGYLDGFSQAKDEAKRLVQDSADAARRDRGSFQLPVMRGFQDSLALALDSIVQGIDGAVQP